MADKIACLIPARNEAGSIAEAVRSFGGALMAFGSVVIVVVDDHSEDETAVRALGAGAQVVPQPEGSRGLADAFRTGTRWVLERDFSLIFHVDADLQYTVDDVASVIEPALGGSLSVGNRLWRHPLGMSDFRYRWNRYLAELVGLVAGVSVSDGQCGMRAFRREIAELPMVASFTYTQEQIIRCAHAGVELIQPDIRFVARADGRSRLVSTPLDYISKTTADLARIAIELGVDLETMNLRRR